MVQAVLFERSFDTMKPISDGRFSLARWSFEVNNNLNILDNNPELISIVRTNCGGLFECSKCRHQWTKKEHSTILFQCNKVSHKIECKLFGHLCLGCRDNTIYHVAKYSNDEIQNAIEFLRYELLRKLHPDTLHGNRREPTEFYQRYGPRRRYANVNFADYCEACRRGDYCRLHSRK